MSQMPGCSSWQYSQSESVTNPSQLPELPASHDSIVCECVRFIINKGCTTKVPIKHADIVKCIHSVKQLTKPETANVLSHAVVKLEEIYGYKLFELSTKQNRSYILALIDPDERCQTGEPSDNQSLLMVVLMHIFMNGVPVKEDDMWKFLDKADVIKMDDLEKRKILTHNFTRESYLTYSKVKNIDGSIDGHTFDWGERAEIEMPRQFLLKKIAQAFNLPVNYWSEKKKFAEESDKLNFPNYSI